MKQTLKTLSSTLLLLLLFSIVMIFIGSSCNPKLGVKIETPTALPWNNGPQKPEPQDTVTWIPFQRLDGSIVQVNLDSLLNGGKVTIDTVLLVGEEVYITEMVPCPDTLLPVTFTRILPSRMVPVSVTVMDTLWLTKPCPPCPTLPTVPEIGGGWGERFAWIGTVAALIFGFFRQWRNEKRGKT